MYLHVADMAASSNLVNNGKARIKSRVQVLKGTDGVKMGWRLAYGACYRVCNTKQSGKKSDILMKLPN